MKNDDEKNTVFPLDSLNDFALDEEDKMPKMAETNIISTVPVAFNGWTKLYYYEATYPPTFTNFGTNRIRWNSLAAGVGNWPQARDKKLEALCWMYKNYYIYEAKLELVVTAMPADALEKQTNNAYIKLEWDQPIWSTLTAYEYPCMDTPQPINDAFTAAGLPLTGTNQTAVQELIWRPWQITNAPGDSKLILLQKRSLWDGQTYDASRYIANNSLWGTPTTCRQFQSCMGGLTVGNDSGGFYCHNAMQCWSHKLTHSTEDYEEESKLDGEDAANIPRKLIGRTSSVQTWAGWFPTSPADDPTTELAFEFRITPAADFDKPAGAPMNIQIGFNDGMYNETSHRVMYQANGRLSRKITFFNPRPLGQTTGV